MSTFNKQFKDNVRLSQNPLTKGATVRTTFDRSHTNKTTFSSGQLIPVYFDEVLPGDTHIIDFKYLIRMSTPTVPTLDNSVIDFHFFYVPTRLLWNDWKAFNGENTSSWTQNTVFNVPRIRKGNPSGVSIPQNAQYWEGAYYDSLLNVSLFNNRLKGYKDWDLAGYLGLPLRKDFFGSSDNIDLTITCLPFFAYAKIWNDWYRDQNVQDEIYIPQSIVSNAASFPVDLLSFGGSQGLGGGSNRTEGNPYGFIDPYNPGQAILAGFGTLPVSKLPDYFTTSLPSPQKGTPVELSINSLRLNGLAEVINRNQFFTRGTQEGQNGIDRSLFAGNLEKRKKHVHQFLTMTNYDVNSNTNDRSFIGINASDAATNWSTFETGTNQAGGGAAYRFSRGNSSLLLNGNADMNSSDNSLLYHDMVADMSTVEANNVRTGITINDLRLAFATQQFLEMDARGGSRYIEILRNHFGVISPDARLQRSEYIGGRRDYTDINQVVATTYNNQDGLGGQQALGNVGAFSLTAGQNNDSIVYSATEHGYIFGFVIVRPLHTYAQGIEKVWTRFTKFDYYWPEFSNIGEQPIYQREIFAPTIGSNVNNNNQYWNSVFGYNEAWAEYRYKLNKASGWFNPNSINYLSAWTYTDNYENAPVLNAEWMRENRGNIQQTLTALQYDQFLIDLYFNVKSTRAMPAFSIPGLNKM